MAFSGFGVKRLTKRRRRQRDNLWPDADDVVFPTTEGGWAQMPRTVPMIATLIDSLSKGENAGRLYVALWGYEFGDGFVEVPDPAQLALEAGYVTSRAERTFAERMARLAELGFIRTARLGLRDHGFALLMDPHPVVVELRKTDPKAVSENWWTAFTARCDRVGIQLQREKPKEAAAGEGTAADALALLKQPKPSDAQPKDRADRQEVRRTAAGKPMRKRSERAQ